jgi:C4-dicarboxylate transporter, DctM subunit
MSDPLPPTSFSAAQGETTSAVSRIALAIFALGFAVAVAAASAMLFLGLPKTLVGTLVVVLSIVLLLMGIPVGIAMLGAALIGLWALSGGRVVTSTLEAVAFDAVDSWSYSVIPMFILMGMILWKSGLTASAFESARRWLGWMPGGLAVATNFAGAALAASSGSTIGITYALGRVSIPEMLKSGYHPKLAVGSVAAAGTLGQIIPPSLLLVVYAGAAAVPVGHQLLAGVVPGIILAFAFAAIIVVLSVLNPKLAPRVDMSSVTWRMRMQSLVDVVPIAIVVLIVIGGLFTGVFTATESGVFGMLAALILGVFHMARSGSSGRAMTDMLRGSVIGTLVGTASVFLLILGVEVLTRAMALSQVPNALSHLILDLGLGRVELLLILILVYLLLGMFMDTLAMMLLTIPVLLAPLEAVGVDPLWFGVFIVVMAEVGLLTPPLGILTFIVHRIASDPEANLGKPISLGTVFLGVLPFAVTAMVVLILLIVFPDIVTWLPGASSSR